MMNYNTNIQQQQIGRNSKYEVRSVGSFLSHFGSRSIRPEFLLVWETFSKLARNKEILERVGKK